MTRQAGPRPVIVEHFDLALFDIELETGRVNVPVVGGWVEIQMALASVPDHEQRLAFALALAGTCTMLRRRTPSLRWYFLHKPPGLKLRFKVGTPQAGLLEELVSGIVGWRFEWIGVTAFGSVFDQAELSPQVFRPDAERLLDSAADQQLAAVIDDRRASVEDWATFLVRLLRRLALDDWLAYEALSRLHRLRRVDIGLEAGVDVDGDESQREEPLLDPSGILECLHDAFEPGFAASVSLLQTLNLMFNTWGLDARTQASILRSARAMTRPMWLED
jgi:hypothetical protein